MANVSLFELVCACGHVLHSEGGDFACPHCQRRAEIRWNIEGEGTERPEPYCMEPEQGREGDNRHRLTMAL